MANKTIAKFKVYEEGTNKEIVDLNEIIKQFPRITIKTIPSLKTKKGDFFHMTPREIRIMKRRWRKAKQSAVIIPLPSTKEMASKCAAVITTQMKKEIEECNKRVDNPNPKLRGIYTDHGST